jgi:Spy/CpxP family protein refolding chaperone
MKRFSALPLTLAVLALVVGLARVPSALAQAPEPRHDRGAHVGDRLQQSLQQLGLNESQQNTVQTLLRTQAKERIQLQAEIDTMRVDLRQQLRADTVDLQSVKSALQAIAAKEVDLQMVHITLMHDIRQVLTPEQQKKFQSLLEQHHTREHGEHP